MKKFKALFIFTAYTIITALLLNTHALTAAEPAKKTIDTQNSKPQITPKNQKLDDLELENSNDLQKPQKKTTFVLDNEIKKFSYALGMEIGTSIKPMPAEFDKESLFKGIANVLDNESKLLTDEEAKNIKMKKFKKMREETNKKMSLAAEENKKLGKKFLSENIKNKNVKSTQSGLQYIILNQGKGDLPKASSTVKVHYKGTLLDGQIFDSSYERGEPVEFPLDRVIKGWTEGVQLMNKGSKFKFFIPAELAYGSQGAPPKIAPESTLIFEIELLDFK